MKRRLGSGLPELMAALVVAGVVAAAVGSFAAVATPAASAARDVLLRIRFRQILEGAASDLDTHRLPLAPLVRTGAPYYTDGSPHAVSSGAAARRPRGDGVLTSTALDTAHTHDVTGGASDTAAERVVRRACPRYDGAGPVRWSEVASVLLVGPDGMTEATVSEPAAAGDGCVTLETRGGRSMSCPQNAGPFVVSLIPVLRHRTYYVDVTGTLRYLSHAGDATRENQPVAAVPSNVTFGAVSTGGVFRFAAYLGAKPDARPVTAASRLSRLGLIEALFAS